MKVMRSTKEGSTCSDCGAAIHIGDPIAYFGPKVVFGLTCHTNPKTIKHLRALQESEAQGSIVGDENAVFPTERPISKTRTPAQGVSVQPNSVSQHMRVDTAQEWVLRVYVQKMTVGNDFHKML